MNSDPVAVLTVREVSVSLGGRGILRDIGFDLHPGRALGIVGASGSGKTMTASVLLGLQPPHASVAGSVLLDGRELIGLDERAWCAIRGRRIALVSQDPLAALTPTMSVGDQITEAITIHQRIARRSARRSAVALMESVGIAGAHRRHRAYPHEFSGGMRRRVAIAMAVANEPDVLIADEPTSALDATVGVRILDLFADLMQQRRVAMMVISHDRAVIERLCHDALTIEDGIAVRRGTDDRESAAFARTKVAATRSPATGGASAVEDPPVLAIRGLTVTYPARRVGWGAARPETVGCVDVDVDVSTGEAVALVGESGSGKTTVLNQVLSFHAPRIGSIELFGVPAGRADRRRTMAVRRRVGAVFQDPSDSLDPRMRVADLVAEPLRIHREQVTAERIDEVLGRVGLTRHLRNRRPGELSGGQQQRVAIARALVLDPKLLILDEPVSALDAPLRAEIMSLLDRLRERYGLAYLMVSHDLDLVRRHVDRIVVLRDGRIVETDCAPQAPPTSFLSSEREFST